MIASNSFAEDNADTNLSGSTTTNILTRDISPYSQNSYFIRNVEGGTITVTLQVAPINDNSYYVDAASATVAVGNNYLVAVTVPMAFARLSVQTSVSTTISAYYFGRA